jgi:hypothetical protein
MFPDIAKEMNFQEGRVLPPSNNTPAQSLFQRDNPFQRNMPGLVSAGTSSVVDASRQAAAPERTGINPVSEATGGEFIEPTPIPTIPPSGQPGSTPFAPSGDQLKLIKPVSPLDIMENPKGAAAQTIGAAVLNNPFISAKGRQALREGRIPQLNDIQPAFYRFTDPATVAALQGLIASSSETGPTLEQQEFFTNVFTAPSL